MNTLPKYCRFKTLPKNNELYLQGNLVSNSHFIMTIDWLLGLKIPRSLGGKALQNRVSKTQLAAVAARIEGKDFKTYNLEKVISHFDLDSFVEVSRDKIKFVEGFHKGDIKMQDKVALSFKIKNAPSFDIEYSAALFFDDSTTLHLRSDRDPIVIKKNNELVALIAPLNPETLKRK